MRIRYYISRALLHVYCLPCLLLLSVVEFCLLSVHSFPLIHTDFIFRFHLSYALPSACRSFLSTVKTYERTRSSRPLTSCSSNAHTLACEIVSQLC